jgi:DNA-binding CsgD family transcriptional regulator
LAKLQERLSFLTPRERDVFPLIVGGLLNKQAASVLGISEVTLQIHRSQIMRKMLAQSFADLVRMAVKLRIRYWRESQPSHSLRARLDTARRPHPGSNHSVVHSPAKVPRRLNALC